ncbi:MAG: FIST signal transduction protein [Myxococcales bacterium]
MKSSILEAKSALGVPPKLGLLFLPIDAPHAQILELAGEQLGAPVVGATTGGAAFTERGFTRDGIVGALLGGDVEIALSVAKGISKSPDALPSAIRSLSEKLGRQAAVLTLADAFACDGEALVSALRESTRVHVKHFGGTAGDNWTFKGTRVFAEGTVLSDAAVFVGLSTSAPLSMSVHHGWFAAEGGRELQVTSADGTVIKTLDRRPAVEVYTEELQRLGLLAKGEEVVKVLALYELGVKTPFGEQLKIRAPLAVGADGSITVASSLREGSIVRIVTTTPDRLIEAAGVLASRVLKPLQTKGLRGSLVFDCAARLQLLADRYGEQVHAFRGGGTHPLLGMACYGEIAKFAGSVEGFHNTTAVMVGW